MSEDATLDDFFESEDGAEASTGGTDEDRSDGTPDGDVERSDGTPENDPAGNRSADAEPFDATVRWTPDGGTCAECGATVERLWQDDAATEAGESGFVCRDCKRW